MNTAARNDKAISLATHVLSHDALRRPNAGRILSIQASFGTVRLHIDGPDKLTLGSLIDWTRHVDKPTVALVPSADTVHVHVDGFLDGVPVTILGVFADDTAAGLAHRVDWNGSSRVISSIHHLRAVQVGAYRTAVAA